MIIFPILAIGPIGGTIIVWLRGSHEDGAIVLWSGAVTTVLWVGVIGGGGVVVGLLEPSWNSGALVAIALGVAMCYGPFAFCVGVITGGLWVVTGRAAKECWRRRNRRPASTPPTDEKGQSRHQATAPIREQTP